jgi:succinyl-CoA synthetase beta subunit
LQLNEHLSKTLVEGYGVACTEGYLAKTAEEAVAAAEKIGYPVGVKAQLPASGRGKAGGIKPADDAAGVEKAFDQVLSIEMGGMVPDSVRIEGWIKPDAEVFLAVAFSAEHGGPIVLFSPTGGVDVESGEPPTVIPVRSDGSLDVAAFNKAAAASPLPAAISRGLLTMAQALIRAYIAVDARLIELNPVGVFGKTVKALDARVILDGNALFRQQAIASAVRASNPRPEEDLERERSGLEYVPLGGSIGLVSGGAGMTLAAMDLIAASGETPACFLDGSANPTADGYRRAFEILKDTPGVEATLISIFGGLTLVDKVAENLVTLLKGGVYDKPVTFRLMGANAQRANEILEAAGYENHRTLESAVAAVIDQARAGRQAVVAGRNA